MTAPSRKGGCPRKGLAAILLAAALPSTLSTTGGCARSVNDYLAEARTNAPQAVKDAAIAIGEILHQKESMGIPFDEADREAILYLKDIARGNSVSINRAAAIAALGRLRTVEADEVLLKGLEDSYWPVRLESARAMGNRGKENFAEALGTLLSQETKPEVRMGAVNALGQIKGPLALRILLEEFLKGRWGELNPRLLAYRAIRDMTGLDYGIDADQNWMDYYRSKYGDMPDPGKEEREEIDLPPRQSPDLEP